MRKIVLAAALLAASAAALGGYEGFLFAADTSSGISFLAPPQDALVVGVFDVKVKYNLGPASEAAMAELYVDEERYFARPIADGKSWGECLFRVQSTDFTDGAHLLTAVVHDTAQEKHYAGRRVRFNNTGAGAVEPEREAPRTDDTQPPQIEIVRPVFGQTVWGKFDILVAASDDSGNPMVSIYVGGRNVLTSNNPPYRWLWDTRLFDNGLYEIDAVAYDRAMNKARANPVAVTVANEKLTTGPEDLLAGGLAARIAPIISQVQSAVHGPLLGVIAAEQAQHRSARISAQAAETPEVRLELEVPLDEVLLREKTPEQHEMADASTSISGHEAESSVTTVGPKWVADVEAARQIVLARHVPLGPQAVLAPQIPSDEADTEPGDVEIGSGPVTPEMLRGAPTASQPVPANDLQKVELARAALAATGHQARTQPASPPSDPSETAPTMIAKAAVAPIARKAEAAKPQASSPAALEPSAPADELEPTRVARAQIPAIVRAVSPVPKVAVYLDNRLVSFDVDPIIRQGYTIAPIRHVIETLGGTVMWYSGNKTVAANCRAKAIRLKIGDREAVVDSQPFEVPLAPYITRGRTMVPLRFLGNVLGLSLHYDQASGIVYASSGEAGGE